MKPTLTEADYIQAAALLNCEVAIIKAVADVESSGSGFLPDGRLVIRFEGHRFRKYTKSRFDASHPTISHPYYSDGRFNKGVNQDYKRFAVAMKLNTDAALMSCSIGKFQIMGDEFWRCGFKDVHAFWDAMKEGEGQHLLAFCRYCKSKGLVDELQRKDWDGFAYGYNGENYRAGGYHIKLPKAYRKYAA